MFAVWIIAVLGMIAALYYLKPILVPILLALILACLLSPATKLLRRFFGMSMTASAVSLFVLLTLAGLYLASLTAESMVQAANTLPSDLERLAGQVSHHLSDIYRDHPYLGRLLPNPSTIDVLGDTNALLLAGLTSYLDDLTVWVAQGLIVLILVLFLLAESEMLTRRLIRFFETPTGADKAVERTLNDLIKRVRAYLLARTLINIAFGGVIALGLTILRVDFALPLGILAGLANFIPYIGSVFGGIVAVLVCMSQSNSLANALIVAAMYLAAVGVEGYMVTPYVMGRSLDLNGTTVLVSCLFWGYLWGIIGLFLAIPITAGLKITFQHVPELHRWAELMSQSWSPPLSGDQRGSVVATPFEQTAPPPPVARNKRSKSRGKASA